MESRRRLRAEWCDVGRGDTKVDVDLSSHSCAEKYDEVTGATSLDHRDLLLPDL